jgi:trimethylamine--corrinoid protein Co-methyltransferase
LIPGATAPATLAGSVTLSLAEALSGLTIHQLRRKGAPLVLGGAHGCMDMKSTVNVYAGPERLLTEWILASIYQHLEIPTWGFGGCSDAQLLDEQAAMEFSVLGLWASLAGVNLAHDTGYLGSGTIGALESLVFNDEIIGYTRHLMRGVAFDMDTRAVDVIDRVGPGGEYLTDEHTLRHYRTEFWRAGLLNRQTHEGWQKAGRQSLGEKLRERVKQILQTHQPVPLGEDVVRKMARHVDPEEA